MKTDAFLLDLDGTLIDSLPDLATAVNLLRGEFFLPPLPQETVAQQVGDGATMLVRRAFPEEVFSAQLVRRFLDHYQTHMLDETRLMPGIENFLFQHQGGKMAVVTNKPYDLTLAILCELGLDAFFCTIVAANGKRPKKPDPQPVLQALSELESPPEKAVMIGDHHTDLRAGQAAGVKTCFCAFGYGNDDGLTYDYLAETTDDLLRLFPAENPLVSSDRRLSQREIALFFFPLLLNVQLMSLSHSLINAALARLAQPVLTLAGFSIAIVLHLCLASPAYQNHTIAIALVRGRRSLFGVGLYVGAVAIYVSALLALVAYTPLGERVLEQWLGVSPAIAAEARAVLAILTFLPFFTGLRGLCQGIVIRARRTGLVSLATLIRIVSLLGFLLLGRRWFHGAAVGAFGLLACIVVETIFMVWFAWKTYSPCVDEDDTGIGAIFRYALPLSFSSAMQQTVPLIISAIISRLPDSAFALAAFGIIRGFIFLLAGPMRNLQQAYLTLVKNRADYHRLKTFYWRVALGMGLVTLAIAFPLNGIVLGKAMGLSFDLRYYIAIPLAICTLYPAISGIIYLYRGAYSANHRTAFLSWATLCKVGYLCTCWLLLILKAPTVPGVFLAVFLLLTCEACEAWYLRSRLKFLA